MGRKYWNPMGNPIVILILRIGGWQLCVYIYSHIQQIAEQLSWTLTSSPLLIFVLRGPGTRSHVTLDTT